MKQFFVLSVLGVLIVPALAFAAPRTFTELVILLVDMINLAIPVLISLGIAFFMYNMLGAFNIFDSGDAVNTQKLREAALWGILILFVMVSIWGILRVLGNTFLSSSSAIAPSSVERGV